MKNWSYEIIYWVGKACLVGILLFLTFNRHSKSGYFNYHSEIWADKAGYYVYLPAAIKFNFNPNHFPDSIDSKTGNGFVLDYTNKKVRTKYTYGVSLMQLPFFCVAESLAESLGFKANGFSPIYHWSINIASVFYLILGLILLTRFLKVRFNNRVAIWVSISIFLGTNLYYYSIDETGMSHIYSFSLFCCFLYFLQKTHYLSTQNLWKNMLFGCIVGLIILIRPTNVIFLFSYFFLDTKSRSTLMERVKTLFHYKIFLPILLGAIIIIFPQLLYWKSIDGSFINYSYENEGFNWASPALLQTWFSPKNGLFLYTPFYFLILFSSINMVIKSARNGLFILILFFVISYVFSSWWDWKFGCAFGARSYVEYLALFSIPVAHIFNHILQLNKKKVIGFGLIVLVFIIFNLKMIYSYDGCFYGEQTWDWNTYFELIKSPTK